MLSAVSGHLLNFASADDCSENGGWAGIPGEDGRNGQRVGEGDRRLRSFSECGGSPPSQTEWWALVISIRRESILIVFM